MPGRVQFWSMSGFGEGDPAADVGFVDELSTYKALDSLAVL